MLTVEEAYEKWLEKNPGKISLFAWDYGDYFVFAPHSSIIEYAWLYDKVDKRTGKVEDFSRFEYQDFIDKITEDLSDEEVEEFYEHLDEQDLGRIDISLDKYNQKLKKRAS